MSVNWTSGAQIRRDLLDAFIEAATPQAAYRAIFSPLPVPSRVGSVKVAPFSSISVAPTSINRAPNTEYNEAVLSLTSVLYECTDVGLQMSMDIAQEYPTNVEMAMAQSLRYKLETAAEAIGVDVLFNPTTGAVRSANGNTTAVSTPWNNPDSNPVGDVAQAYETIAEKSGGITPNTLVIGQAAFVALKQHPEVIYRMPATILKGDAEVAQALSGVFGVENVVVSRVADETGVKWPRDTALLAVTAPANSLASTPAACRLVYWSDDGDISREGWLVETYDKEETRSHIIRARRNAGYLVISNRGLYGLTSVVT